MSLTSQFYTDAKKEIEGIEIRLPENDDGTVPTFVLSRMGKQNKRYTKLVEVRIKPHRRAMDLGTMNNEIAEEIINEVFAETVVKGWSNVKLSDVTGNKSDTGDADFSKSNAVALFKRLPELCDYLQKQAQDASNFRDEALEEEAKN